MVPHKYYYFCVVLPVLLMYSHIHVKIYRAGKHLNYLNYLWPKSIQYIIDSCVVRLKQFSSASLYDGVIGS